MLGMTGQAGIVDIASPAVGLEIRSHCHAVFIVSLHSDVQSLCPTKAKPGIPWTWDGAGGFSNEVDLLGETVKPVAPEVTKPPTRAGVLEGGRGVLG